MDKISYIGLFIAIILAIFSLSQLGKMFSASSAKRRGKIYLHLLGFISNGLIAFLVFSDALGLQLDSNILVNSSLAIATAFFIAAGLDTLYIVKKN